MRQLLRVLPLLLSILPKCAASNPYASPGGTNYAYSEEVYSSEYGSEESGEEGEGEYGGYANPYGGGYGYGEFGQQQPSPHGQGQHHGQQPHWPPQQPSGQWPRPAPPPSGGYPMCPPSSASPQMIAPQPMYPCPPATQQTQQPQQTESTTVAGVSETTQASGVNGTASSTAQTTTAAGSTQSSNGTTATATSSSNSSSAPSASTSASSAATSSATASSGADALSTAKRNAVLNVHNTFRSQLAQGTAQNKTGTMPAGSNIIQLAYDTNLEAGAQSWANNCTLTHASSEVRNGAGENIFWTSNQTETKAEVITEAANVWWAELANIGMDASLNLTLSAFNSGIGHWTQMAWATTATLGCGVANCTGNLYVVCRYSPAGNTINELIYQSGTACSTCSQYANNTGCSNGLCALSS